MPVRRETFKISRSDKEPCYAMNKKSHAAPHWREADMLLHDQKLDGLLIFLATFLGLCALIAGALIVAAWYLQQMPAL